MRVICVVDNAARRGSSFWGEHGVSFLIEVEGQRLLFDTGQSGQVLLHNLQQLDVAPGEISAVALSHAHRDHTGGLTALLVEAQGLPIYAHPDIFRPRYSRHGSDVDPIGIPWERTAIVGRGSLRLNAAPVEVAPGVWTTGEITPRTEIEGRSPRHLIAEGDRWVPDPYRDDMSLVLHTDTGLVVVCGCCHAGLLNTLAVVRRQERRIHAVLGGTHLASASESDLERIIARLDHRYDRPLLYLNHCTGEKAYVALALAFGDRVSYLPAGASLTF